MSKRRICLIIILTILTILFYLFFRRVYLSKINFNTYTTPKILGNDDMIKNSNLFANSKVVICGLIRNGESVIPHLKGKIKQISSQFKEYTVLVVENDSKDKTRALLLQWARENYRVKVLGCGGVNSKECNLNMKETIVHDNSVYRIQKMVYLRNVYMDYLQQSEFDDYNFCIVMDMDLISNIYNDGLVSTAQLFSDNPTLNAVAANGVSYNSLGPASVFIYYDPYAHRDVGNSPFMKNINDMHSLLTRFYYLNDPIVKVDSAFSGFTVYRMNNFRKKKYILTQDENGETECEHVGLNRQLQSMVLNPKMLFVVFENK
jgi:hypothetical protein